MKHLLRSVIVLASFAFAFNASAQSAPKFGHIDFAKLYSMMPGQDSVKAVFENYQKSLASQFEAMQTELQNKYNDYQTNLSTMSDIIKQTKEKEIQDLQMRMEAFQQQAQIDLQKKESDLTAPMIEKARIAVEDVAKVNGYTYVFNAAEGLLLYAEPSEDMMPLVKKKLGIQ